MAQAAVNPIDSMVRSYEAAYNAGDASALAALFTEDAVLMPPDGPDMIGPEGVRAFYQPWFDQYAGDLTIALEESQTLGDWTFGRGTFSVTLTPKAGGDALQLAGKWININVMQPDGTLKIARHIWNLPLGLTPAGG